MTATITKQCVCGTDVEVEPLAPDSWAARLPFDLGVTCAECAAKARAAMTDEDRERAAEHRVQATARRRAVAQIPVTLRDVGGWDTLDTLKPQAQAALKAWAGGKVKGVLLSGPVGAGKTFAAAVAAWLFLERRELIWTSAPLLFARLGSGLGTPPREQAVSVLSGYKPLVLDDLDKARPTEYGAEQIFLAVDHRVSNGVPLLITTNLAVGEIARRFAEPFGEALGSRLAGYCEQHKIEGRDRRLDPQAATGGGLVDEARIFGFSEDEAERVRWAEDRRR